jgi:hypothetical protein
VSKGWELKVDKTIAKSMHAAASRGLAIGAEHVLGEARKTVPIEEATLERSGATSLDPENLKAAVTFDTPYAVVQHEDMGLRHDAGRSAKYLETAMNSETTTVREIIARTIRGEL